MLNSLLNLMKIHGGHGAGHTEVPYIIPRGFLYACAAFAVLSVVFVAYVQITGHGKVRRPLGEIAMERSLLFRDAPGGVVTVLDAQSKEELRRFGVGEGAFLRSAMRSMALKRNTRGADLLAPYKIMKTTDDTLVLFDPETGHFIKPRAFGSVATDSYSGLIDG